jgi:hypothetical protein
MAISQILHEILQKVFVFGIRLILHNQTFTHENLTHKFKFVMKDFLVQTYLIILIIIYEQ